MTGFALTKLYREQHGRVRETLKKMHAGATVDEQRSLLCQLSGQVTLHLRGEDDSLYPRLLAHKDVQVRSKAKALQNSMGELTGAFSAFHRTWTKPGAIAAAPDRYTTAMRGVAVALTKRMDLEDRELYDLADQVLAT